MGHTFLKFNGPLFFLRKIMLFDNDQHLEEWFPDLDSKITLTCGFSGKIFRNTENRTRVFRVEALQDLFNSKY